MLLLRYGNSDISALRHFFKWRILPVFIIRRDQLSEDLNAAIIYHHIDGGNVLRREMVT